MKRISVRHSLSVVFTPLQVGSEGKRGRANFPLYSCLPSGLHRRAGRRLRAGRPLCRHNRCFPGAVQILYVVS